MPGAGGFRPGCRCGACAEAALCWASESHPTNLSGWEACPPAERNASRVDLYNMKTMHSRTQSGNHHASGTAIDGSVRSEREASSIDADQWAALGLDDPRMKRDAPSVRETEDAHHNAAEAAHVAAREAQRPTSMGGGGGTTEKERLTGYRPLEADRNFEICCATCVQKFGQSNCECGLCEDAPICWCSDDYRIESPDGSASMCPPGFQACPSGDEVNEPSRGEEPAALAPAGLS